MKEKIYTNNNMDFKEEIIKNIGEKRFEHSLRVRDLSVELARHYGLDENKAAIAGYYHDCAKFRDYDTLLEKIKEYNLELTEDMRKAPQVIHSFLGASMTKKDYGVKDSDVLNAIRYHTTGRENMSDLEKIVFLADYTEPKRNFSGVEKARALSFQNLNEAMFYSLNGTLGNLITKKNYIALLTIKARNYILLEIKNENIL